MYGVMMVMRKERKKGGAVSPCAFTALKPISFRIVGRKTGRDENETLQEKYINYLQLAFGAEIHHQAQLQNRSRREKVDIPQESTPLDPPAPSISLLS